MEKFKLAVKKQLSWLAWEWKYFKCSHAIDVLYKISSLFSSYVALIFTLSVLIYSEPEPYWSILICMYIKNVEMCRSVSFSISVLQIFLVERMQVFVFSGIW